MKKFIGLFIIPFLPFGAWAQQGLTFDQALQIGLKQSKSLQLSQDKVKLNATRYREARSQLFPKVTLNANYTRLSDVPDFLFQLPGNDVPFDFYPNIPNVYTFGVNLKQPLFTGFKLKTGTEIANENQQAVQYDYEVDQSAEKLNLAGNFINYYKALQAEHVVESYIAQAQKHLKDMQNLKQNGLATGNDVLKVQLQVSNADLQQIDLQNAVKQTAAVLNIALDYPVDSILQIDTNSINASLPAPGPYDDYLNQSLKNRVELKAANSRLDIASKNISINKSNYFPQLNLSGDYFDNNPNQRYFPPSATFHTGWDAGVSFSWDISGLFTNKNNVQDAQIQAEEASLNQSQLIDNIRLDVKQAYLGYTDALKKIEVANTVIEQTAQNVKTEHDRYANSISTESDVVDAEVMWLQAQIQLSNAKADALMAYQKLLKSTGQLSQ